MRPGWQRAGAVAFASALCLAPCRGVERTWTDSLGRRIRAHLVGDDGARIRLDTGRDLITVPETGLGAEDRAFLQSRRTARAGLARGTLQAHPVTRKLGAGEAVYRASAAARKAADYFQRWHARLAQDAGGVARLPPDAAFALAPADQSALVHIPDGYDDTAAFGVYLHLAPGDEGVVPDGYAPVLAQRRLLWLSPDRVGNRRGEWERAVRALDALASLDAEYLVDPRRITIGGFSGGGYMSFWIQMLHPERFAAAVNHGRDFPLLKERAADGRVYAAAMPFLAENDLRDIAARPNRWAFLMGDADPNHPRLAGQIGDWQRIGFKARVFEMKGVGHQPADPATFDAALAWIEGR